MAFKELAIDAAGPEGAQRSAGRASGIQHTSKLDSLEELRFRPVLKQVSLTDERSVKYRIGGGHQSSQTLELLEHARLATSSRPLRGTVENPVNGHLNGLSAAAEVDSLPEHPADCHCPPPLEMLAHICGALRELRGAGLTDGE
jgi:hypothetical protein